MSKTTNKIQMDIVLKLMEENRDIACGFQTRNREDVGKFWKQAEQQLNAAGPPIKNVTEWKKVWIDQKKKVRNKAAHNLKMKRGTGGGPNREQKFTPLEEAIYDLVGTKEAVEGVAAKKFGCPSKLQDVTALAPECAQEEVAESSIDAEIAMLLEDDYEPITTSKISASEPPATNIHTYEPPTSSKNVSTNKNCTVASVLEKQLAIQGKIFDQMKEIADELKKQSTEFGASLKKIYRSLDRSNDLKKKLLEQSTRNNAEMLKLRKIEVEGKVDRNRRMIEIEEMKLKIQQKNSK